jgi:type IV pilus assembly protein PilQ
MLMDMVIIKGSKAVVELSRRVNSLAKAALLVGSLLLLAAQAKAVSLTDIQFGALPGGKVEIRMDFDQAPPEPKGYTIERPARIALDLEGVSSQLSQKKHNLSFDNAQSVVVLEAGGRTRVIINLVELTAYDARVDGNSLVVEVGNDVVRDYLKEPQSEIARMGDDERRDAESGSITALDFQRGEEGEGKLVLTLANPKVDVDVRLEGSEIKLVFLDTDVPENLQRRYDVIDFATPVQRVDVKSSDGEANIGIKVTGDYDYLAYQADDIYVVSVKPLTEEELEAKKKEFAYVGDKLSLNFQDIEVRAVLQLIADFTDLNLVASDTVSGKITLRLQNVPWDQALELILKTKGLDKRQVGNVLMVAPAAEIAERERQEIETNKQLEELAPLQTEFIKILYADANELFELFDDDNDDGGDSGDGPSTASILSPRGTVIVDERTNSLLITETAEKLEEFRRLIKLIDVPLRQVLIEARIVIASTDFSKQLGVKWGGAKIGSLNENPLDLGGSLDTVDGTLRDSNRSPLTATFPDALGVDLGVATPTSSIAIGYTSSDLLLAFELSALEASNLGEVVSQPKVITGDKQKASIESGTEIPYQTASSSGETTIEFKDAVLKLDVTPRITPDDRIIMKLKINQDSIGEFVDGEFGSQIPTIDTTELSTEVLVDNGETVVLGGIFQIEDIEAVSKTPFLGDIPYLGRLFKRTTNSETKTETLIFITPRILADQVLD